MKARLVAKLKAARERKISAALAAQGHVTRTGKPHVVSAIQNMLC